MDFYEILDQIVAFLRRRGRVSYRALKRHFRLDDAYLEDLKIEIIEVQQCAIDQANTMLVWVGQPDRHLLPPDTATQQDIQVHPTGGTSTAERRQLTVMFCDLVDSTALASRLDPEDLRDVVRAYQTTCADVIQRYSGHIAQYLGDGLLVYFGYPQVHEDEAQRAVHAGLEILEAVSGLQARLAVHLEGQCAVRLGLHTGLVVIGELGESSRQEYLALGETPNITARLQGLAAPNTLVISAATYRLVQGYFTCQDLGLRALRGVTTPLRVYRVLEASTARSRLDAAGPTGLTPLVGREAEFALLLERWQHSQDGQARTVLLSGEAGIGKSRLVQALQQRLAGAEVTHFTLRCSPYHTHSAFYAVIEHTQRLLGWRRDETPAAKLDTLEHLIRTAGGALDDMVPLFAALLSVPLPAGRYPPLRLSPQQQKHKILAALTRWLAAEARRQPVLMVWEDLHWADPSTLELLCHLISHLPTMTRLLVVLTCRPELQPPWPSDPSVTQLTLTRFTPLQVEMMVTRILRGQTLPREVMQHVVAKTDGIPLFIEELLKMILESGLVAQTEGRYVLTGPLPAHAIPTTLQDSLMARLDRLPPVKEVAQVGAVIGREFAYDLMQAVAPVDEAMLQQGLAQLVDAEVLYQRGQPPHTRYLFKHALIQEAAYQSLLRSTRQQYHQRIARVLEQQFPETTATHPDLVAHHYTEAGLVEHAIPHWRQAGRHAIECSAHLEAVSHLRKGLDLLRTLPHTPERTQDELAWQLTLGATLVKTKGYGAADVEQAYAHAWELCQQVGDTPQSSRVLLGLWAFYMTRAQFHTARALGEQFLQLTGTQDNPGLLVMGHHILGATALFAGNFPAAQAHFEQSIVLEEEPQQREAFLPSAATVPRVGNLFYSGLTLWHAGYPDQALRRSQAAITLAHTLEHPFSVVTAYVFAAMLQQLRRDAPAVQAHAEAAMALSTEQEFTFWRALSSILLGWALVEQGQNEAGLAQLRQGLADYQATGAVLGHPYYLAMLAESYGKVGQVETGLQALEEAQVVMDRHGERWWEAELYRLQGVLLLQPGRQAPASARALSATVRHAHEAEPERHMQRALEVARHQGSKLWELRAALSLSRLWQRQGKRHAARQLLEAVQSQLSEAEETIESQDARALLDRLA